MSANGTPPAGAIRDLRRAASLTQQEVAARANCSIAMVRLLENGYAPANGSEVRQRVLAVLNDVAPADGERDEEVERDGARRIRA